MGKVKTKISNDAEAIAEWVGRKLVNHDPMSVREKPSKTKVAQDMRDRIRETRKVKFPAPQSVTYALDNGQVFLITVEEIVGDESEPEQLLA
jgi:hypothetical protein